MTNAEKFKEVFGITIDKNAADPCDIFDHSICVNHECEGCPACNFWKKEYTEKQLMTMVESKG